ncbi:MAG: indole-3-glycerol phosphate synthase TrpC [Planctomycetota bacterium]|nr:indole-3-glycerol phosphate synthase TrpC [Planctomycetota bacterium]
MANLLQSILARKRIEVDAALQTVPLELLRERISELGRPRNFFQAVVAHGNKSTTRIIAEVKGKSPSAGVIRDPFDPVAIARAYHSNGASAISCLTDEVGFGGRLEFIHQIRDAVPLPVLRKDFIIDEYQVYESRANGADAILLIAECLTESQIVDFQILAIELGMTVLLEVHDMKNLYRAHPYIGFPHSGYSLLGINNRNLKTMKVDLTHCMRMAEVIDDTSVLVAESGVHSGEDLKRLRDHGIHIALVGEHLCRQPDPGNALKVLLAPPAS